MTVLDGVFWVVSLVLVASGATKLADPAPLGRALVELRVVRDASASGAAARGLGVVELLVGGAALAIGGRWTALAVAVAYLVFTAIVVVSWRRGLGSCGCFGSRSASPRPSHAVLNAASAAVAIAAVRWPAPAVADGLELASWHPVLVVALVLVGAAAVIVADTR